MANYSEFTEISERWPLGCSSVGLIGVSKREAKEGRKEEKERECPPDNLPRSFNPI